MPSVAALLYSSWLFLHVWPQHPRTISRCLLYVANELIRDITLDWFSWHCLEFTCERALSALSWLLCKNIHIIDFGRFMIRLFRRPVLGANCAKCAIAWHKHRDRHFLCPICSDQSSAGSHGSTAVACVSACLCARRIDAACLPFLQSPVTLIVHHAPGLRNNTSWPFSLAPLWNASFDPECLDGPCLHLRMPVQPPT